MTVFSEFRGLHPGVWALSAIRLIVTWGFSMVLPLLTWHLAKERGVSPITAGFIWTVANAAGAGMQWVAGELSDKWGRRPLMWGASFLRVMNLLALGWALAVHASVSAIGALCVWNGILRAFFDPVANALVADLATDQQRVAAFSLQRLGTNIGWSAGPAVAGIALAAGVPYSTLFFWSAPITFVAAVGLYWVPCPAHVPRTRSATDRSRLADFLAYRHDQRFMWFLAGTFLFFVLQAQMFVTLSYYAARTLKLTQVEVTHIYTLNGLLVVLLQLPAVALIRHVGRTRSLLLGCLGYAIAYATVGLTVGHLSVLVCVALVTLAEVLLAPSQQATVPSLAPTGRVGAYSGIFGLAQITGQSAGPLIGASVLEALPHRLAWIALGLFGVFAFFCYRTGSRMSATPAETTALRAS
ncbi:MAG: MFS transporter [Deltaproteobacteria bacterium]|nr:MFS transporter [Deltaproteobacteria bacterium]